MEEIVSTLIFMLIPHYFRPEAYILEGGGCMNPGTTLQSPYGTWATSVGLGLSPSFDPFLPTVRLPVRC